MMIYKLYEKVLTAILYSKKIIYGIPRQCPSGSACAAIQDVFTLFARWIFDKVSDKYPVLSTTPSWPAPGINASFSFIINDRFANKPQSNVCAKFKSDNNFGRPSRSMPYRVKNGESSFASKLWTPRNATSSSDVLIRRVCWSNLCWTILVSRTFVKALRICLDNFFTPIYARNIADAF